MNAAAQAVMQELSDLVLGYGVSDEFRYAASLPIRTSTIETKLDCLEVIE